MCRRAYVARFLLLVAGGTAAHTISVQPDSHFGVLFATAVATDATDGISPALLAEHASDDFGPLQLKMRAHFAENGSKCANPQALVIRNGQVMLPADLRGKAKVAASLPRDLIAKRLLKCPSEFATSQVARQLHAAITSSRTKCSRMAEGASGPSK